MNRKVEHQCILGLTAHIAANFTAYGFAALIMGASLLVAPIQSQAFLIDQGNTVLDDVNNTEWLKLTETLGLSYNNVVNHLNGTSPIVGLGNDWTIATDEDIKGLWSEAGIEPSQRTYSIETSEVVAAFISLIGDTNPAIPPSYNPDPGAPRATAIGHWSATDEVVVTVLGTSIVIPDWSCARITFILDDKTFSDPAAGVYLVRSGSTVPEPGSTVLLLAGSLAAIGCLKQRYQVQV